MRVTRAVLVGGWLLVAGPPAARAEDPMKPHGKPAAPAPLNRLAGERSPYLKQHQSNPVDWWPWGPEAFAEAKRLDKPVFLSIGYAACHWCHVMAHESFEDEATAKVMNEVFLNVKVDREERPDVDDVYMAAVQLTTGHGGWPMSVYLLPDGRPFLARTYLRKQDVVATAVRVAELWKTDRARIEGAADELADAIRQQAAGPRLPAHTGSDAELVAEAVAQSVASFDRERGGFDRRPKFPPHAHLLAFLDRDGTAAGPEALEMARVTLDGMARGGVHDHVGGGFHRYSTDAEWLVPHFEKMLYDNALLACAYARAAVVLKEPRHAEVVRGILGWVEREMAVAGGGYASSLDADTDGEEGLTYTWTPDEVRAALPDAGLAALVLDVYGVRDGGNYLEEASGKPSGRSILHLREPLAKTAARLGRPLADLDRDLARARATLLAVRARRAQPGLDGKVLTSWNGLLLSAFAAAGTALHEPRFLDAGRALARFLLDHARDGDRLLRFPKASGPAIPGFLDDHVHLADGLLDLADATGEPAWADAARALADQVLARFADPAGGFFATSDAHERLLARSKDAFDTPIPSANATAARVLLRLADRTGLASYRAAADRTIATFRALVARAPGGTMAFVRVVAARAAAEARGVVPVAGDVSGREGPLAVEAFLERGEARPGTVVRVLLRVTLDPGWHVNPAGPARGDLVPTSLTLAAPATVELRSVGFPAATSAPPGPGAAPVPLLAGTFDVEAALAIPAGAALGPRKVGLVLGFQPCDATSCRLPTSLRVDLPLRFEAQDAPPRHPALFK
ncbi:MAG: thioredoxin domain-containing protein [Planctomycetota bacterium]